MSEPTFQIPKEVIEPIIQAHVTKAVVEAFGNRTAILDAAVRAALEVKVGSDGTTRNAGYSSDITWLQWAVRACIQAAAKSAIEEALKQHGETLKQTIISQLRNQRSPLAKDLAESMVRGLSAESALKYRLTVSVGE